ncbi:hypothetical protein [Hymenobacter bucti]|uniref:Lipoprotein n=1 Tax=Hymenobacter bucti TaxID=1844114 RepID=A0ABW4QSE5_9BACT
MKNSLLLLAGAAALSLASCSQEKTTETTTTTSAGATATPDTAAYRTRSNRVSEKFITDMKITDPAMQGKIRTAYYNRSKRYSEMTSKYATDTTGMAAAMRQYNADTDTEFQGVITDPTQYQSYQSSRSTYDESSYMDDASSANTAPADNSDATSASASTDMTSGAAVKESKTKMEDGSKIKLKDDGTVKVKGEPTDGAALKDSKTKLEDGTKIKIKGDGTVKVKDANGEKTKM